MEIQYFKIERPTVPILLASKRSDLFGGAKWNRFDKMSISSSRVRATVRRTAAFESFDSPHHKYHTKLKDHPDGWSFSLVEYNLQHLNPKKFYLQPVLGCFQYFCEGYSLHAGLRFLH